MKLHIDKGLIFRMYKKFKIKNTNPPTNQKTLTTTKKSLKLK